VSQSGLNIDFCAYFTFLKMAFLRTKVIASQVAHIGDQTPYDDQR
jgi:hypothetical protein